MSIDGNIAVPDVDKGAPTTTSIIGREQELAEFLAVLDSTTPALIAVVGAPGAGKSLFLRQLGDNAVVRGWTVIPSDASEPIAVTPDTTVESFHRQLQDLLRIDLDSLSLGRQDTPWPAPTLATQLRQHAPLVVLVDEYRQSATFESWFATEFIPALKGGTGRVIIMIAADSDRAMVLKSIADVSIPLKRLDEAFIRAQIAGIGKFIAPPMTAPELETYVQAVAEDFELLGHLTRVLLELAGPTHASKPALQ